MQSKKRMKEVIYLPSRFQNSAITVTSLTQLPQFLYEKLIVTQLVMKHPASYGTSRFISTRTEIFKVKKIQATVFWVVTLYLRF